MPGWPVLGKGDAFTLNRVGDYATRLTLLKREPRKTIEQRRMIMPVDLFYRKPERSPFGSKRHRFYDSETGTFMRMSATPPPPGKIWRIDMGRAYFTRVAIFFVITLQITVAFS